MGPYVGSLPIHFNSAWLNSRLLDLKSIRDGLGRIGVDGSADYAGLMLILGYFARILELLSDLARFRCMVSMIR